MRIRDISDLFAAIVVGAFLGGIMGLLILEAGWGVIGILTGMVVVIWAGERFLGWIR
jgi:hypothetical protein